ncbi:hypothetical protein SNL152K_3580 [Streptomyces sp. NL15-2K]|nr:hypothetical protein SNL152K_3580 [Streptomyces sp. NL15-2K]
MSPSTVVVTSVTLKFGLSVRGYGDVITPSRVNGPRDGRGPAPSLDAVICVPGDGVLGADPAD